MLCALWKQRSFCWFKVRQVPSILISYWLVQKVPPRFKLVYYSYIWVHSLQFPQTYVCSYFPSFTSASPWDMNLHPRHPPYLGLYHHLQCQEAGSVGASWADKTYSHSHIALHLLVACLWIVVSTFLWGKNMVILIIILLRHMILFRSFPPLFFFNPVLTLWLLPST